MGLLLVPEMFSRVSHQEMKRPHVVGDHLNLPSEISVSRVPYLGSMYVAPVTPWQVSAHAALHVGAVIEDECRISKLQPNARTGGMPSPRLV